MMPAPTEQALPHPQLVLVRALKWASNVLALKAMCFARLLLSQVLQPPAVYGLVLHPWEPE